MLVADKHYLYWWKPAGLPSSFGDAYSFMDALVEEKEEILAYQPDLPKLVENQTISYGYRPADWAEWRQQLLERFPKEQEYGLLNRLDTVTQGWLYFAQDNAIYVRYHGLQRMSELRKQYVACISGDISWVFKKEYPGVTLIDETTFSIELPLMHHVELDDRMVVLKDWDAAKKTSSHISKGRGTPQPGKTVCEVVRNDTDKSRLLVTISTGIRHQIRAHLAAISYPIVGEHLYAQSGNEDELQLWSVGLLTE